MFAALADLTVDPCAQIVGNYLRGNGLDKCRESFQGVHLLSTVRGMEKGRRNSIAQKPVSRNFDTIPVFVHLFVLHALDLAQIVGGQTLSPVRMQRQNHHHLNRTLPRTGILSASIKYLFFSYAKQFIF